MGELQLENRREFLKWIAGTAALLCGMKLPAGITLKTKTRKLTVLYTNDQHSRIEPFPLNDVKYPGQGGFARRASVIKKIRKEEHQVLLLDAGDIFQGTPYFNFYKGELEYQLMSEMGYDAVTLGNHDFDLGTDNLIQQMRLATFSFVNCNYDFTNTCLHGKIVPYKTYTKNGIKIGVLGVGIELEGLVDKKLYGSVKYNNPSDCANKIATHLKNNLHCDYVICLSHLGYQYDSDKMSDCVFAAQTKNIDLIIGGHTHTFLDEPVKRANSEGKEVLITQVGWAGIWLGRIDIYFSESNKKIFQTSNNQKI